MPGKIPTCTSCRFEGLLIATMQYWHYAVTCTYLETLFTIRVSRSITASINVRCKLRSSRAAAAQVFTFGA
jgi:hypothetical protein